MSEPTPRPPIIELVDVVKSFDRGQILSLNGLSFRVAEGERVAVTGPSGCGKSTTLHLIAALDRPDSGTIRVDGADLSAIKDLAEYRRTKIGMIFQFHYLFPHLSAIQNLEIALVGGQLTRAERHQRALDLLGAVNLSDRLHQVPAKLSGGERQRVAIARALANDPRIILADEPTGNLDEASVARMLDLFRQLHDTHPALTLILVTHDRRIAETADRVIELSAGRVRD